MTEQSDSSVKQAEEAISIAEFLESVPPASVTRISDLTVEEPGSSNVEFHTPEIQLHCSDDSCNGMRFFRFSDRYRPSVSDEDFSFFYVTYRCSNCRRVEKTFSLAAQQDEMDYSGRAYKFGELPVYGPPTPARLISLIGPDRETFLKGRRCENQGLGVGAFVYYRRVVENQKSRILNEIIKVSRKLNVPKDQIDVLVAAEAEIQFSKALKMVKDAIPQVLLINGLNPLTLLHSALSDGLHDRTDEHCLEIANSVRVVLGELSERLGQALKDEAELAKALSTLMTRPNDG